MNPARVIGCRYFSGLLLPQFRQRSVIYFLNFSAAGHLVFGVVARATDFNPEYASLLTLGLLNLQFMAILVSQNLH